MSDKEMEARARIYCLEFVRPADEPNWFETSRHMIAFAKSELAAQAEQIEVYRKMLSQTTFMDFPAFSLSPAKEPGGK